MKLEYATGKREYRDCLPTPHTQPQLDLETRPIVDLSAVPADQRG